MKKIVLVISVYFFLNIPKPCLAINPPTILSPTYDQITSDTSPKLEWSNDNPCPESQSCYKVEISSNKSFDQIEKETYTNNTYYSPSLKEGFWFWRIKAKNQNNTWSDFNTSQFQITSSLSTPKPTISSTSTPSPVPTEKTTQQFLITSSDNLVTEEKIVVINTSITNFQPNTDFYLKVAFYKEGKTNYFGLTKVESNWIKNNENYSKQKKVTTNEQGNWNGIIETKIDLNDTGFEQKGSYLFKVGRYSQSGAGPTWSNTLPITIDAEKTSTVQNTEKVNEQTDSQNIDPPTFEEYASVLAETDNREKETTNTSMINYTLPKLDSSKEAEPNRAIVQDYQSKKTNWWFIAAGITFLILVPISIVNTNKKRYYQS